jgi:Xaa-Pro aminopeptidase
MRLKAAIRNLEPSCDLAIVTKKENIYYLTGFMPTAFALLVLSDNPFLAVSEMDASLASEVDLEVRVLKSFKKELKFRGEVAVEKRHTTLSFVEEFLKSCELIDLKAIDEMRQVKDQGEVSFIKQAIEITEAALEGLETEGRSEKEVAANVVYDISRIGKVSFDPIVASGLNSAVPHHVPSSKKILRGEQVIIDLGARVENYNCDLTRTLAEHTPPYFKEVYMAVADAQREGIKQIKPGVPTNICDASVREVLREYGFEEYFVHSSGHGVGLEVHEAPKISKESEDTFKEGMVVTVEPGVYIPKWGGVRIEDVVFVGKKPKILSTFPKMET